MIFEMNSKATIKPKCSNDGRSEQNSDHDRPKRPRKPANNTHALQVGIRDFLSIPSSQSLLRELAIPTETITKSLPKRFTVYEPLLLLPANAFNAPPEWGSFCAALSPEQKSSLYDSIAKTFHRFDVTHVAVNAPIALSTQGQENRMRSPTGLIPLHGDFGSLCAPTGEENGQPSQADLERAFWVQTVQNHGIKQFWAPLHTMFSRGNVKEKARILGEGPSQGTFVGLDEQSLEGRKSSDIAVVDMYAGIGYFVFSYLKRGVKRVWGWELNGWSVEGLRRGCEANRWGCRIVRVLEDGKLDTTIEHLVDSLSAQDRVVIFHGDNRFAADILAQIQQVMEAQKIWNPVRHVNLGLLPSSQPSWNNACKILDYQRGGWIHVHENVDVRRTEQMKEGIINQMTELRKSVYSECGIPGSPFVDCCHIEHVKTYAPGVMHCVFDIRVSPPQGAHT
ncbi:hypothetical protein N7532_005424 [Penicillium argentinense]|uniref:tRNA wybutosine-synthesizing protein 2 n=1 Tax=Penicillium argentinense TaxID=1131581 RepID=A0A9W9FDW5_9EURO|nr:uncharacterized protein N7532_005424 [Penicillium argentinense]KAJ5098423.1 hypothetical protein N7532_005424 [Penicillium argentinense]